MGVDGNTGLAVAKGRPPAVLQIVPRLGSGGAERGTVDIAGALVAAGWTSYVASAGGPLERDVVRAGSTHLTLPLASKNPWQLRRNATALARLIRRFQFELSAALSSCRLISQKSSTGQEGRRRTRRSLPPSV